MTVHDIEKKWETELRKSYPGVIVRENHRVPHEDPEDPLLDVFMIPDDLRHPFFVFMLDDMWKLLEKGFPGVYLMPHSVTETRERFPTQYAEFTKAAKSATATVQRNKKEPASVAPKKSRASKTVSAK